VTGATDCAVRIDAVRAGRGPAVAWLLETLAAIDGARGLNCFTTVLDDSVLGEAAAVDADPSGLPLAGMPFAVKDLFDVAGHTTLAGAKMNLDAPGATQDATLVARLRRAGAVLVGMTNMDEFAYGFSTENAHFGPTRNPHDPLRIAGGSSGGSAAAVAAGLVPVALGSDTNGSIRVPASLCGIFGLKPTFGRLSRAGVYPFVASLDHPGIHARTVADMARAYDAMVGPDPRDPACSARPGEAILPELSAAPGDIRVGILDGWFAHGMADEARAAVDAVASAFAHARRVSVEGTEAARAAAFCMTAIEGGSLHAGELRARPLMFDPAVRDRLLAGLLVPAELAMQVRRVRRLYADRFRQAMRDFDLFIAPATPCCAPRIGETYVVIEGREVPVRANLGIYTQPISFIGLPALAVPVALPGLPIGVQLIGPAWSEKRLMQVAAMLARQGVAAAAPVPAPMALPA
jgi:AtzE family amidohydrolase